MIYALGFALNLLETDAIAHSRRRRLSECTRVRAARQVSVTAPVLVSGALWTKAMFAVGKSEE